MGRIQIAKIVDEVQFSPEEYSEPLMDIIDPEEKYYSPAVYQLRFIDNFNRDGGYIVDQKDWGYDSDTNYISSGTCEASGMTYVKFVVEHWNYIDNDDIYLRVNVKQSSEASYDYGAIIVSRISNLDDSSLYNLRTIARSTGDYPANTDVKLFNGINDTIGTDYSISCSNSADNNNPVYIYLVYSKDGSGDQGSDKFWVKFLEGRFQETLISEEVIYNDVTE